MLTPTEGVVYLRGKRVDPRKNELEGVGYCPQADILIGELTVQEHLQVFHRVKGIDGTLRNQDIRRTLEQVQLWEERDKPANALSGGMKRRLSLAISLIGDPDVVCLDEPTNGLDPVLRKSFWVLLQNVLKDKAVLLTTHLLTEVEVLCSEVAVLVEGQLRAIGHPAVVKRNYAGGPRIQLIYKVNSTESQISQNTKTLKRAFPELKVTPSGINPRVFYAQSPAAVFPGLASQGPAFNMRATFEWLSSSAADPTSPLESWSVSLGGLEDAFLRILDIYSSSKELDYFNPKPPVPIAGTNLATADERVAELT